MKPKAGIFIKMTNYRYIAQQSKYIVTIKQLPGDDIFEESPSLRHELAWLSLTRADLSATANMSSQVTHNSLNKDNIRRINKVLRNFEGTRATVSQNQKLDVETGRIVGNSDSSFANNADLSTQLRHIIVLTDQSGRVHVFSYASYKSERVVQSVLSGEAYVFADWSDAAFTFRDKIYRVSNRMGRTAVIKN